jgi:hypothetical protein
MLEIFLNNPTRMLSASFHILASSLGARRTSGTNKPFECIIFHTKNSNFDSIEAP